MQNQKELISAFVLLCIATIVTTAYITLVIVRLVEVNEQMSQLKRVYNITTIGNTKEIEYHKITPVYKEPPVGKNLYLLAQIIHAEAKGEPYDGKIAVGNVVLNRVKSPGFPDTIKEVVYQKGQFSPVSDGSINNEPNEESIQAAKDVLKGLKVVSDNTLFFYNPDIATSSWIFSREVIREIGSHVFAI